MNKMGSKWGKNVTGSFSAAYSSIWADLGAHFKNFISNMVVIYLNRSFSWNINKIGSKVEKNYGLNFGSGEPFCELISKFRIKYWLWYIKIDRFHWLSIKLVQNWKQLYGLTFGSSDPIWELISEYYMRYSLWYIKIDSFHKPSMIHCIQAVCQI